MPTTSLSELRRRAEHELTTDILPFWARRAFEPDTGNLVGVVTNDLRTLSSGPRHVVLCARILWTFAAAQRVVPSTQWLEAGRKALSLLEGPFWDVSNGGVYWSLDEQARPLSRRKQVYAQAFAIYGLAEWYAATGDMTALARAQTLFRLLESRARDLADHGYIEALSENWGQLEDMRLSDKDLNSPKSMNTLLHVMEAYTTLLRVWPDAGLRAALKDLLESLLDKVYTETPFPRFALFFDMQWRSLNDKISYGHDIETSWLIWEAALAIGDKALLERTRPITLKMARAVLSNGVDADGSVFYDGDASGVLNDQKHWWPQAEAVIGFLNAHQLDQNPASLQATLKVWDFIEAKVVDHRFGEWFSNLDRQGNPLGDYEQNPDYCKIGPWKCPYHNARACIEVLRRLPA